MSASKEIAQADDEQGEAAFVREMAMWEAASDEDWHTIERLLEKPSKLSAPCNEYRRIINEH